MRGKTTLTSAGHKVASSSDLIVRQWEAERPDLDMERFGILLRIRALALLMDQQRERVSKELGLKSSEMYVLYALRRRGKPYCMRPTDIFKLLNVTSGTITYRIDRLEKEGMVQRLLDPEDRRSVVIQLTPKGKRAVDKSVDLTAKFFPKLDPIMRYRAKLANFVEVLRELGSIYDQEVSDEENPLKHARVSESSSRKVPR